MRRSAARFVDKKGPAAIHHYGGKRAVMITANVDPDIITSAEINKLIRKKLARDVHEVDCVRSLARLHFIKLF